MAFLGDFGKIFLGGAKTGDVAAATALAFGADPGTAAGVRASSQAAADAISGGDDRPDVATSPAQAGVDSTSTILNVSQTGQLQPGGMGNRMQQTQQAGFGLMGPLSQILGQGARTLARPGVGGALTGFGAGAIVDFFINEFGQERKLVITRKLQRDIKKIFIMTQGDVRTTSDIYRSATGRFIPEDLILKILFKTFKNQGPFVTKAAVRKTRQTIRKMETLCDLKDRLCPPKRAATRRRMPAKSTTITNVR